MKKHERRPSDQRRSVFRRAFRGPELWLGLAAALWTLALSVSLVPFMPDEAQHLDYGWNLASGRLPSFEAGLTAPLSVSIEGPQWTAHHPPLYPALLAITAGPLIDAGNDTIGLYVARATGALLVGGSVVAVGRLASLTFPRVPQAPLAASLVMAASPALAFWGSLVVNDVLALATSLVAVVGVAALIRGRGGGWVVVLPPVGATLTLATRAHGIATVLLCATALAVASWRADARRRPKLGRAALATLLVPTALTAAFWLRNISQTGSIVGFREDYYEELGRTVLPALQVATDFGIWAFVLQWLVPGGVAVSLLLGLAALVWLRREGRMARLQRDDLLVLALPVGLAASSVVLFIGYVAAGGGIFPRYLLPVLPAVAILAGPGLTFVRRLPYLLPLVLVVGGWTQLVILLLQEWPYFDPIDMRLTAFLASAAFFCLVVSVSRATSTDVVRSRGSRPVTTGAAVSTAEAESKRGSDREC